jgi:hypothetical protein
MKDGRTHMAHKAEHAVEALRLWVRRKRGNRKLPESATGARRLRPQEQ